MLGLAVRAPAAVAVGAKPTLQLVVQNRSRVPCVRALDKNLQEVVLLDARGTRVWGSNDCFPSAGSDTRTLAAGAAVSLPLVWGGLSSEPTCTARRTLPAAGDYVLRGRLDTKISPDSPARLCAELALDVALQDRRLRQPGQALADAAGPASPTPSTACRSSTVAASSFCSPPKWSTSRSMIAAGSRGTRRAAGSRAG